MHPGSLWTLFENPAKTKISHVYECSKMFTTFLSRKLLISFWLYTHFPREDLCKRRKQFVKLTRFAKISHNNGRFVAWLTADCVHAVTGNLPLNVTTIGGHITSLFWHRPKLSANKTCTLIVNKMVLKFLQLQLKDTKWRTVTVVFLCRVVDNSAFLIKL